MSAMDAIELAKGIIKDTATLKEFLAFYHSPTDGILRTIADIEWAASNKRSVACFKGHVPAAIILNWTVGTLHNHVKRYGPLKLYEKRPKQPWKKKDKKEPQDAV